MRVVNGVVYVAFDDEVYALGATVEAQNAETHEDQWCNHGITRATLVRECNRDFATVIVGPASKSPSTSSYL